jgi:hypothetical protein
MGSIPATPSTKHASCFPPSSMPASIEISIKLIVSWVVLGRAAAGSRPAALLPPATPPIASAAAPSSQQPPPYQAAARCGIKRAGAPFCYRRSAGRATISASVPGGLVAGSWLELRGLVRGRLCSLLSLHAVVALFHHAVANTFVYVRKVIYYNAEVPSKRGTARVGRCNR